MPYATLGPLKALLPLKTGDSEIPADKNGVGGVRIGRLARRMRVRWQTISHLWNENKRQVTKLDLLERLDYHGELSAQLEWQQNSGQRPVRILYTSSGQPTAVLLRDNRAMVENVLFWVTCRDSLEAHYLLAVINSDTVATAVNKFTTANWAGNTRHLHKHLWKLPIPEFDESIELHTAVSEAGGSGGGRRGQTIKAAAAGTGSGDGQNSPSGAARVVAWVVGGAGGGGYCGQVVARRVGHESGPGSRNKYQP